MVYYYKIYKCVVIVDIMCAYIMVQWCMVGWSDVGWSDGRMVGWSVPVYSLSRLVLHLRVNDNIRTSIGDHKDYNTIE